MREGAPEIKRGTGIPNVAGERESIGEQEDIGRLVR
jgi:hypothetical protein